jgi:hypothetical protein
MSKNDLTEKRTPLYVATLVSSIDIQSYLNFVFGQAEVKNASRSRVDHRPSKKSENASHRKSVFTETKVRKSRFEQCPNGSKHI